MKRQREPLGKLCDLVKGISPISKTPPGPYTLVTTGEEHKSADTFQFDGETVCIPIISSTGHGHASLKRVHHQVGKFALSNLLVAALVKDPSVLSARYLARYLTHIKDRLIAPLMTGVANMSISIDRLATVPIEFPPLSVQERIVDLLDEADELRKLRARADRRTADLIPALFHEMFGDPASNPRRLPTQTLGSLTTVIGGGTPSTKNSSYWDGIIPWVSSKDMSVEEVYDTQDHISENALADSATQLIPLESVLVVTRSGILKHTLPVALNMVDVAINQDIKAFIPNASCRSLFLAAQLRVLAPTILSIVRTGATVHNIETDALKKLHLLVPPVHEQDEFALKIKEVRTLRGDQAASRQRLEALFQSLLHHAFNGAL